MDNKQLLEQIKNIVKTEVEPINKRLDILEKGQAQIHTVIAQNTSMIEALKEGQESSTAAIRADIQDLASKMAKNKKEVDIRLDSLDEHTGHHNPIKH